MYFWNADLLWVQTQQFGGVYFTNRFMTDWDTQELADPTDLIIVWQGYISRRNVQTPSGPGQPIMIFADAIFPRINVSVNCDLIFTGLHRLIWSQFRWSIAVSIQWWKWYYFKISLKNNFRTVLIIGQILVNSKQPCSWRFDFEQWSAQAAVKYSP